MRLVLDANVVASALVLPSGWTATRLAKGDIVAIVPEGLIDELVENEAFLADRAGCATVLWHQRVERFVRGAQIVPTSKLRRLARNRIVVAASRVDPDDAPYAAAYVASGADFLWTRDRKLLEALPGIAVLEPPPL